VNAGSKIWNETTQKNWRRDRITGSSVMVSPRQGLARPAVRRSLNSSGREPDRRQVGRLLRSLLPSLTDRKASIDRPKLSKLVVDRSFRNSQAASPRPHFPDAWRAATSRPFRAAPTGRNLGHNPLCRRFRVRERLDFETMPASWREAPRDCPQLAKPQRRSTSSKSQAPSPCSDIPTLQACRTAAGRGFIGSWAFRVRGLPTSPSALR
jgi:hypothetical protein